MTYLLGLRLEGRDVLVVGGGRVAGRRVPFLLDAGAQVTVVSPEVTPELEGLAAANRITWHRGEYHSDNLSPGCWLVHTATNSAAVNAAVAADAENAHVWCVRADDSKASAAWTPPASGGNPGVTVGVVTDGDPRRAAGQRDAISEAYVVPGISSALAAPAAAGIPVTSGGAVRDPHIVTAHVAPDDPRNTVDWRGLATGSGTIVVLMGVRRIEDVSQALIERGRAGDTAAALIQEGTLPTRRTVMATLETVAQRAAEAEIRPPAVLAVGEVVRVAHDLDILEALRSTGLPPASDDAGRATGERATTVDRGS